MFNTTSRALIFNDKNEVYLVIHNYLNPENNGKWSTPGGRMEDHDQDELTCLKREIAEEFGAESVNRIDFGQKVGVFIKASRFGKQDTVTHHFFYCRLQSGKTISPSKHQSEIIEGRFCTIEDVLKIEKENNFILGCEAQYIESILN